MFFHSLSVTTLSTQAFPKEQNIEIVQCSLTNLKLNAGLNLRLSISPIKKLPQTCIGNGLIGFEKVNQLPEKIDRRKKDHNNIQPITTGP